MKRPNIDDLTDIAIIAFSWWLLLAGCKSPAPVEPVTEQPREARPVLLNVHTNTLTNIHWGTNIYIVLTNGVSLLNIPQDRVTVAMPYAFYTNAEQDALVEQQALGPPVLPGRGPFPLHVVPNTPAVSNWMTKAILPKPMTNQIPGSTILSRITTTGSDGKPFTAELTLEGNQTIQANDRMAVVIFSINTPSYTIEVCTNLLDGKWYPMASGTGGNTNNGALVIVDLKEDSAPIKFYRQKPGL